MFKEMFLRAFGYKAVGPGLLSMMTQGSTTSPRPVRDNMREFLGRYADQAWVFVCIAIIQTKLAGVPLKVYRKTGTKVEELPDHPLNLLLSSPNMFMTGYDFFESITGFLGLVGNAYAALDEFVNGKPTAMYPLDPSKVKIRASKDKFITGYIYEPMPGVEPIVFDPSEILHFKTWNPLDPFYGQPPLSAGRDSADLVMSADRYNKMFFENNAEPGGALVSDTPIDETSFKRISVMWKKAHQGIRKAHKIAIMDGGLKWQDITKSHRDMQFVDLKHLSREDVLGVYRVPPSMAGLYTDAKYDNADMQRKTFWQDTMPGWCKKVENVVNMGLVKPYDPGVFVAFDLSNVPELQEDKLQKAQEDEILTRAGIKLINEVRADRKLPKVAWGDTWNAPIGLMAIDERPEPDTTSPAPGEDPDADEEPPKPGKEKPKPAPKPDEESDADKAVNKSLLRREMLWLDFKGRTERVERKWDAQLSRMFSVEEREVKENLRRHWEKKSVNARLNGNNPGLVKQALDVILFNGSEARKLFRKEGRKLMTFTLSSAAAAEAQRYDMVALDLTNPRVTRWLDEKAFKFADEVNDTTEAALREQLQLAVTEGESIDTVVKRIEDVFDAARGYRARTIARTEVVAASNKGAMELYTQNGVQRVEWLTARDANVRETHLIDGQKRGVGEKFSNGLEFPGDPAAGADEICNCRCAIAPASKEE